MLRFTIHPSLLIAVWLAMIGLCPPNVGATSQEPEVICYEGTEYALFSTPLEDYFQKMGEKPDLDRTGNITRGCTANYRGYVGTWEIRNDSLWLLSLHKMCWDTSDPPEIPIERVFPDQTGPVFAQWYTDTLRIPQGDLLRFVYSGFASIYERDILLAVKEGIVVGVSERDNHGVADYRSDLDLALCADVDQPIDTGNWVDARLLCTPYMDSYRSSGQTFKTRGLYLEDDEPPYEHYLWIEETPKTDDIDIYLYDLSEDSLGDLTATIEVEAVFPKPDLCNHLRVLSFRSLEPGETLHSAAYPRIMDSLENAGCFKVVLATPGDRNIYDTVVCERYESFIAFAVDSPVTVTQIHPVVRDGTDFRATIIDEYGKAVSVASMPAMGDYPAVFEPCPRLEPGETYRLYLNVVASYCDSMTVRVSQQTGSAENQGFEVLYSGSNRDPRKDGACMAFKLIGVTPAIGPR